VSKGGAVFLNERNELVDLREKISGATFRVATPEKGQVENLPHKDTPTPWYNAGLYAFRPSIFEFTAKLKPSPRGEYELTDAVRELARSGKKVKALELIGEWADVRDPEILTRLNRV
jgi:dTDP-glucose pyrophosphorylase